MEELLLTLEAGRQKEEFFYFINDLEGSTFIKKEDGMLHSIHPMAPQVFPRNGRAEALQDRFQPRFHSEQRKIVRCRSRKSSKTFT